MDRGRQLRLVGKQVNFFMAGDDEANFIKFVRSTGDVILLGHKSLTPEFQPIEEPPVPGSEDFWYSMWFFNRSVPGSLISEYIPQQGYYLVEDNESNAVEFDRSGIVDNRWMRGRIYAEFLRLDKDATQLIPKPIEFQRWYESIAGFLRKTYKRREEFYFGPCALSLYEEMKPTPVQGWTALEIPPRG